MIKLKRLIAMGLVIASMAMVAVIPAFADENNRFDNIESDFNKMVKVSAGESATSKAAYDNLVKEWQSGTGKFEGKLPNKNGSSPYSSQQSASITFSGTTRYYNNTDPTVLEKDLNTFKSYVNDIEQNVAQGNASQSQEQLQNAIKNMSPQANLTGATESLGGFSKLISLATGTIVVGVTMLMAVFTAFDVAYLVFPVAKSGMDKAGNSGNRMASSTNKTTGESKFRWVTDDAMSAWEDANQTGQNPLFLYAKKRIISYIALAFILFIFMTGRLGLIMEMSLRVFSNVFEAIIGAAGV